jgi:hypothetical protein
MKSTIENKEEILDAMANSAIKDLDMKNLLEIAYESAYTYLETLTDAELMEAILTRMPDLEPDVVWS